MVFPGGAMHHWRANLSGISAVAAFAFAGFMEIRYPGSFMAWARPVEKAGQFVFEMRLAKAPDS